LMQKQDGQDRLCSRIAASDRQGHVKNMTAVHSKSSV
jgi:hypothetical protein